MKLVAFAACLALSLASPALAGGRSHGHRAWDDEHRDHGNPHRSHRSHHGDHDHRYDHVYHRGHDGHGCRKPVRHHASFEVPVYIAPHAGQFRSYYHGQVRHARHGHGHAVYHFPVWTEAGRGWQAVEYCRGRRFEHAHAAPRIHLELNF
jgi:hypothetical protein